MIEKLYNLIKACFVSSEEDDSKPYAVISISHDGAIQKAAHLTPYGHYSNPPKNSTGLVFLVGGESSKAVAMVNVDNLRFKNLKKGEVKTGNPLTGSYIYYDINGNIKEFSNKDITVNIKNDNEITIQGKYKLTVDGTGEITFGGNVTLVAPSFVVKDPDNNAESLVKFSELQTWINSHVHTDPQGGFTGVPTTQIPVTAETTVLKGV